MPGIKIVWMAAEHEINISSAISSIQSNTVIITQFQVQEFSNG
jgi:hypothetical protein